MIKDYYRHGPTKSKSYYSGDLVVCVMRGGFTRVEQTLFESGRGGSVIEQRMNFQEAMADRFKAVISGATGREVVGFMSGNQQNPDPLAELFILAPTDILADE